MNRRRFDDLTILTASIPKALFESIENACTKQGVSRSAWLRTVLQQVLSVDDAGTVEEEDSETSTRKIRKF